jgi:hypothetical protein
VLTVWGWTVEVLDEWFTEIRLLFGADGNPAAWPSERGLRIGCQRLNSRFIAYRQALGLDDGLDLHSLRRPCVTHLIEDGWDPRFVQEEVGHEHASTTSIYTCVSSDFRTRTLRRRLDATVAAALQPLTALNRIRWPRWILGWRLQCRRGKAGAAIHLPLDQLFGVDAFDRAVVVGQGEASDAISSTPRCASGHRRSTPGP